jgi:hypothetical protein
MLVPGNSHRHKCPACQAARGTSCKGEVTCQIRIDRAPKIEIPDDWKETQAGILKAKIAKWRRKGPPRAREANKMPGRMLKNMDDHDIL